jgi:hypothetical protein
MPQARSLKKHLLKAPFSGPVNADVRRATEEVAEKLIVVGQAAREYVALIDRAPDYLDMFVFFTDLDFALSRLKFVFADFERSHFAWARFLVVEDEPGEPEPPGEDAPIPIDGGDYFPEDPAWIETNESILGEVKRLMLKRGEDDTFWFFDDPFCDESYLQGAVSSNVAEIYADLIEIRDRIDELDRAWDEEAYSHIQDLIEYHTTHHIMILLRPVQYLIGKDI